MRGRGAAAARRRRSRRAQHVPHLLPHQLERTRSVRRCPKQLDGTRAVADLLDDQPLVRAQQLVLVGLHGGRSSSHRSCRQGSLAVHHSY